MMNIDDLIDEDYKFNDDLFYDDFHEFMNSWQTQEEIAPIYTEDPSLIWQDLVTPEWETPITAEKSAIIAMNNSLRSQKNSIENINFQVTDNGNYRVQSKYDIFSQNFFFEPMQMFDGQLYENFINATERCIRTSLVYKAYIAYLKTEIGLTYDAFNANISHDVASLEMHHGPIFTLYDYVKIMMDYAFDVGIPVSTFSIAKLVMNEHEQNRVQVVMLTKNNHKLVHAGQLHVDLRQCHGSLYDFVHLYAKYIKRSPKLLRKLNDYKISLESGTFNDVSIITPTKTVDWSIQIPYNVA